MAPSRIVLFGASGFTGRMVAQRLIAAGSLPVLAGRDPARLEALAEQLGAPDLDVVKADVYRQNSIYDLVGKGDVLVSTVGPFAKWGDIAVRAAVAAGAVYIDSTGEPSFIRRIFEEFGTPARNHGASLLTAMGFDFVPGTLAGALALEQAGPEAVRVDVGYYSLGGGMDSASAGTKQSLVGVTLDPSFAWRDGELVTARPAERVRSFLVAGRERPGISTGSAEHFSLPDVYPQLREVNTYIGWFGPLSRALQAGSLATSVITRVPGARPVMQATAERLAAMAPSRTHDSETTTSSCVVGVAYDTAGDQLAEVRLTGADGYDFTADFIAWAARRAASAGVEGTGALGPVEAFGLDVLERGVAEAGLARA
jgi:short subunit dehydrogenase-like uncharacterized protein